MRECGQERQTESARESKRGGRGERKRGGGGERENRRTREGVGTMRERFNQTNAYK